jgi:hypothetical protein
LRSEEEKDYKIEQLRHRVTILQENEIRLIQELKEQQIVAKDAFRKMQEIQDVESLERDRMRGQYEQFYNQKYVDEVEKFEAKIKSLENINEELLQKLRTLETEKTMQEAQRNLDISSEMIIMRRELQACTVENENLKDEVRKDK